MAVFLLIICTMILPLIFCVTNMHTCKMNCFHLCKKQPSCNTDFRKNLCTRICHVLTRPSSKKIKIKQTKKSCTAKCVLERTIYKQVAKNMYNSHRCNTEMKRCSDKCRYERKSSNIAFTI